MDPEHHFFFFFLNAMEENRVENIRGCGLEEGEVQFQKLLCVHLSQITRLTGLGQATRLKESLLQSDRLVALICGDLCTVL